MTMISLKSGEKVSITHEIDFVDILRKHLGEEASDYFTDVVINFKEEIVDLNAELDKLTEEIENHEMDKYRCEDIMEKIIYSLEKDLDRSREVLALL